LSFHNLSLDLRLARFGDVFKLYEWRNRNETSIIYASAAKVRFVKHSRWFIKTLFSNQSRIYIFEIDKRAAGVIRFDLDSVSSATVSISLDAKFRGKGLSKILLNCGLDVATALGLSEVNAKIHNQNFKSIALFKSLGFQLRNSQEFLAFSRGL
jgi:RimJ/RimL family protein N-acetyltransferase